VRLSLDLAPFKDPTSLWPSWFGFEAYRTVFLRTPVLRWYWNSIFVTGFTLIFTLPCSALAGYALSRFRSTETTIFGYLILVAKMIPAGLLAIPLYVLFSRLKLLNNLFALVIANATFAIPFCTWMLKSFFDELPRELEDAAEVDGCNVLGRFVWVILPLSRPGLAAAAIYTAVVTWSEYILAVTFMTHPKNWTAPVGVVSFKGEYIVRWNEVMAASLVFTLPLLVVFAFFQKYLVKGLTAGAIK